MSYTLRFTLPFCVAGCIFAVAAQEAPKPQLTARELFYSAASQPAPAAKAPPKTAAKAPPRKDTPAPAQTATGNQPGPGVMTPPHIVMGRVPLEDSPIQPVSTAPAPATGAA